MNRRIALLVAVVALVGLAGIAAAGPVGSVVAQDDAGTADGDAESDGTEPTNETADISPGERLSGVIGVQNAEVAGEVESRAFEVGLDRATTDEERAAVVGDRLDRSEQRLEEIEARQQELRERRDAGELSEGAFAARMAATSARAEQIKRDANRSADVARDLPAEARAERGLDDERLNRLRDRAGNASGPETAAIARGIAGNGVGGPLAQNRRGAPNGTPGGPGERGADGSAGVGGPPGAGERGANGSAGAGGPPTEASGNASARGNATPGGENAPDRPGEDGERAGSSNNRPADTGNNDRPGNAGTSNRLENAGSDTDRPGGAGSDTDRPGNAGSDTDRSGGAGSDTDRPGNAGSDTDRSGGAGSDASQDSTVIERGGNATDTDRRSASHAVETVRTIAVDSALSGWSTADEPVGVADFRLRNGVIGIASTPGLDR